MTDGLLTKFVWRLLRRNREEGNRPIRYGLVPASVWFARERRRVAPQLERQAWQRELRAWQDREHADDHW